MGILFLRKNTVVLIYKCIVYKGLLKQERGWKMKKKVHSHKVTINEKRRTNKQVSDFKSKTANKKAIKEVFNSYYKDQVRALYNAVYNSKWN